MNTAAATQLLAATIGNGNAVHAVEYDDIDPKYGPVIVANGNRFSARTLCGQVSAGKGYRTRPNAAVEAEVSCKKCSAALAR